MMKHIPRYVCKHGSFSNFDGSRPEYFGKIMVKDHALTTNRSRKTVNYDVAVRQTEAKLFHRLQKIAETRGKRDLFGYAKSLGSVTKKMITKRFRFRETVSVKQNQCCDGVVSRNIEFDWMNSKIPENGFDTVMVSKICDRLFRHDASSGGIVVPRNDYIHGFTEYRPPDSEYIFRAHPFYRNDGPWNDWAFFNWDVHEALVPAKIYMFLDLRRNKFDYGTSLPDDEIDLKLDQDLFVVVRSARDEIETSTDEESPLTDFHFQSKIGYRVYIENKFRIIPIDSLVEPAYVIDNVPMAGEEWDRTSYVVKPMREWADIFMNYTETNPQLKRDM